jgi:protein-S-isoprenylcysteine O-methyltransferase Ste14
MIFLGGILHLLVVLLPLLCLGLGGTAVRDPATLAFLVGASALYTGDAVTMRWTISPAPSPVNDRARRWASVTGAVLLILFWASLLERSLSEPAISSLQVAGVSLLSAGVSLRAIAVCTLGRDFRTEIDVRAGALVRSGVYGFLRHPSESGLLAATLGATLLLQSTWGLIVWCVALVPLTLVRLSHEERALTRRFGETYQRYVKEVGAVLPLATRGL